MTANAHEIAQHIKVAARVCELKRLAEDTTEHYQQMLRASGSANLLPTSSARPSGGSRRLSTNRSRAARSLICRSCLWCGSDADDGLPEEHFKLRLMLLGRLLPPPRKGDAYRF
jgi:hypothetical protein